MKKHIAELNLIIFPFILIFGFFISVLESYKYIGFFQKHFYIPSILFYLLPFASFVGLVKSKRLLEKLKKKKQVQKFLIFGTVAFFTLVLLYVILNELEVTHYNNFLYTTFHIWPGSLIFPVVLLFEPAFLFFSINRNFVKLDNKIYRKLKSCRLIRIYSRF